MDIKFNNNSSLTFNPFIQVECITSHGNEYIDTGVLPRNNITIEMEFSFNSVSGSPYGTQTSSYNVQALSLSLYSGTTYYMLSNTQGTTATALTTGKRYHVEHKMGKQILYDIEDSSTLLINDTKGTSSLNSSKNIYLFARNSNSGVTGKTYINMYYCKIYQDSTLIRDYVPSYNNYKYCLYDKVSKTYYHDLGGGAFTYNTSLGGSGLSQRIRNLFIKDCPQIDAFDVLRRITIAQQTVQNKLIRVRCNIGDVSGTLEELQHYSTLSGYSDNYEEQVKPRMIGTWTINTYHSNAEKEAIDIDGLTILSDDNYNAEYLLANDMLAVQTLDSTAPNYNPAAAIVLQGAGYGRTLDNPIVEGESGKWFLAKSVASTFTSVSTRFRQITTIQDTNGIVSSDTEATYDFESFNEFQYFTSVTSIVGGTSAGSSNPTVLGGFGGCTKLKSIILPNSITSIGICGFYNCNKLEYIYIPNNNISCTSMSCFYNLSSITNLKLPGNAQTYIFTSRSNVANGTIGDGTGILSIKGNYSSTQNNGTALLRFNSIIIYGNVVGNSNNYGLFYTSAIVRVKGTFTIGTNSYTTFRDNTCPMLDVNGNILYTGSKNLGTVTKIHIGYTDAVITASPTKLSLSSGKNIYIGKGLSRQDDEDTIALYTNNTNWASYLSYLSTWYDYNGEYKTYYITDNLTNCTNTNPDAWPHITRGESYETTIVPDEGYSLQNSHVTIEMLDTDTTSPTYDTMIDVTADCTLGYDPGTGEVIIQIPSVTGNVVITASAS